MGASAGLHVPSRAHLTQLGRLTRRSEERKKKKSTMSKLSCPRQIQASNWGNAWTKLTHTHKTREIKDHPQDTCLRAWPREGNLWRHPQKGQVLFIWAGRLCAKQLLIKALRFFTSRRGAWQSYCTKVWMLAMIGQMHPIAITLQS